jgi:AcrR family transcriptional regulator
VGFKQGSLRIFDSEKRNSSFKNMIDTKAMWVGAGYEAFAHSGQRGLKIEVLAKKVGISKSSFYHHFADIDNFRDVLFQQHLLQSTRMASEESKATTIDPDLIHILITHKVDLLFNRQLRFNRIDKACQEVLDKSNQIIGTGFVTLWAKDLNLARNEKQLMGLFELALENFFLQINEDVLEYAWLSAYFKNLKRIALGLV